MTGWPATVPPLSGPEAIRAAKRLYRFAVRKTWTGPVKLTSGKRHTWVRHGTFYVNPASWKTLVFDLSWYFYRTDAPLIKRRPTADKFATKLVEEIVKRGWLVNATLKERELPPGELEIRKHIEREIKLRKQLEAGVKRWTTKLSRAQTMLTKYERRLKRYNRSAGTATQDA